MGYNSNIPEMERAWNNLLVSEFWGDQNIVIFYVPAKLQEKKLLDHIVSNQHKNLKVGRPTICYTRFECLVFLGLYPTILTRVGPPDPKAANGLFSVRQSLSKRGVYLIIESQIDENDRGMTETNS